MKMRHEISRLVTASAIGLVLVGVGAVSNPVAATDPECLNSGDGESARACFWDWHAGFDVDDVLQVCDTRDGDSYGGWAQLRRNGNVIETVRTFGGGGECDSKWKELAENVQFRMEVCRIRDTTRSACATRFVHT